LVVVGSVRELSERPRTLTGLRRGRQTNTRTSTCRVVDVDEHVKRPMRTTAQCLAAISGKLRLVCTYPECT
jgi:hypothetical protein